MKKAFSFTIILLFLITVTVVLIFYISPAEIVEIIGVGNGYFLVFIMALTGGVSMFTSVSFHATVVTLALGGLEPVFIALTAAPALFAGDSLFYLLGKHGREAFLTRYEKKINTWVQRFEKKPRYFTTFFIYIYTGFTPLPLDILMITLALTKYPYKKMILPVILGHITFLALMGYIAKASLFIY